MPDTARILSALCLAILFALPPLPAPAQTGAAPEAGNPLRLAQDAAYCRNWAARIESDRSAWNSRCSGQLDPSAYANCQRWLNEINAEVRRYNASCAR